MILIVGGAGYIGSHIQKLFWQKGQSILILDNLERGHRDFVKWGEFIQCDLRSYDNLVTVFKRFDIDCVIHLAAYAYVGESVTQPLLYYSNNVVGTINLLRAMDTCNVKKIVFSSTCATYGVPDDAVEKISEETPQIPINAYGQSKLMVEKILWDLSKSSNFKFVILRYFNAAGADVDVEVGERHNPETHLIPLIFDAISGKIPHLGVFGNDYPTHDGTCIRDYIHVTDLANAHWLSYQFLSSQKVGFFNLGNEKGYSIFEIISLVEKITGRKVPYRIEERRKGDPPVLVSSAKKANNTLGWKTQFGIEEIIKTAWVWYQKDNGMVKL